jgi:hypothetical protein
MLRGEERRNLVKTEYEMVWNFGERMGAFKDKAISCPNRDSEQKILRLK